MDQVFEIDNYLEGLQYPPSVQVGGVLQRLVGLQQFLRQLDL